MRNRWNAARWIVCRAALSLARLAAPGGCDYGNRVHKAVGDFFFYTSHGYMPESRSK